MGPKRTSPHAIHTLGTFPWYDGSWLKRSQKLTRTTQAQARFCLTLRRPGSHVTYACACVVRVNQPLLLNVRRRTGMGKRWNGKGWNGGFGSWAVCSVYGNYFYERGAIVTSDGYMNSIKPVEALSVFFTVVQNGPAARLNNVLATYYSTLGLYTNGSRLEDKVCSGVGETCGYKR